MKPIVITGTKGKILWKSENGEWQKIPIYSQTELTEDLPTTLLGIPVKYISDWDGWSLGGGDLVFCGNIKESFYNLFNDAFGEVPVEKKIPFTMAKNFRFPPIKSIKHREYLSSLEWGDKENIMWYPRIRATTQLVWPLVERIDP